MYESRQINIYKLYNTRLSMKITLSIYGLHSSTNNFPLGQNAIVSQFKNYEITTCDDTENCLLHNKFMTDLMNSSGKFILYYANSCLTLV